MLKVIEIAFCCYAVTDMARARRFYESALGLKPCHHRLPDAKWMEYEFLLHSLSIGSMPGRNPVPTVHRRPGSGGFRRRHRASARTGREVPDRAVSHARLPHGHDF